MRPRVGSGEFLDRLYGAAHDARLWPDLFQLMSDQLGADAVLATFVSKTETSQEVLASTLPARFLRDYADYWWQEDLWMQGAARLAGQAVTTVDVDPLDQLRQRPIYHDFAKQYGRFRYVAGAVLPIGSSLLVFGLHRMGGSTDFSDHDRRVISQVLPHLQRSILLRQRFSALETQLSLTQAALDTVPYALLITDAAARPLFLNKAAEAHLVLKDGLYGGVGGFPLRAAVPEVSQALWRGVAAAALREAECPHMALRLPRPSGQPDLLATILASPGTGRLPTPLSRPAALIVIQDPAADPIPNEILLQRLYKLTPAEATLACYLARGERIEDIAEQRGVKISTIRSQLRAVLQKTDTDRQGSLIRLITLLGHAPLSR